MLSSYALAIDWSVPCDDGETIGESKLPVAVAHASWLCPLRVAFTAILFITCICNKPRWTPISAQTDQLCLPSTWHSTKPYATLIERAYPDNTSKGGAFNACRQTNTVSNSIIVHATINIPNTAQYWDPQDVITLAVTIALTL